MSQYVKINSDNTRKLLGKKPNWFLEDGTQVTDQWLIENENIYPVRLQEITSGYVNLISKPLEEWELKGDHIEKNFKIVVDNKPDYDPWYQYIELNDESEWPEENDTITKTYTLYSLSFEEFKTKMFRTLAEQRWRYETGGFVITIGTNNYNFYSDRETQSKVANILQYSTVLDFPLNWKYFNGFIALTLEEMNILNEQLLIFVQQCYDREKEIFNIINGINEEDDYPTLFSNLLDNEFKTNWPENALNDGEIPDPLTFNRIFE